MSYLCDAKEGPLVFTFLPLSYVVSFSSIFMVPINRSQIRSPSNYCFSWNFSCTWDPAPTSAFPSCMIPWASWRTAAPICWGLSLFHPPPVRGSHCYPAASNPVPTFHFRICFLGSPLVLTVVSWVTQHRDVRNLRFACKHYGGIPSETTCGGGEGSKIGQTKTLKCIMQL